MNASTRLDCLLADIVKTTTNNFSSNGICQETSMKPSTKLTFVDHDSHPSNITATLTLPVRRNSLSKKHHRRRHPVDQTDTQKQNQPLLNSSTLDDLFRALTLECEQYIAATSKIQKKKSDETLGQPESNDDDYENLNAKRSSPITKTTLSPLKTSIEVMSPIKRHVLSITVTSKISSPQLVSPTKSACITTAPIITPTVCQSSEDDSKNLSSSSTNRKRRRRARKQMLSSSTTLTRSSSSSNERNNVVIHKKSNISKRSFSIDPHYQHNKTTNNISSSTSNSKQQRKHPRRRDISLQSTIPMSERSHAHENLPLSVLLTSTKYPTDFLESSQQRRRSRLETFDHKPTLLHDRIHQQFYRHIHNNHNKKKQHSFTPKSIVSSLLI